MSDGLERARSEARDFIGQTYLEHRLNADRDGRYRDALQQKLMAIEKDLSKSIAIGESAHVQDMAVLRDGVAAARAVIAACWLAQHGQSLTRPAGSATPREGDSKAWIRA